MEVGRNIKAGGKENAMAKMAGKRGTGWHHTRSLGPRMDYFRGKVGGRQL